MSSPEVRKYSYVTPPRCYSPPTATTGQVIGQPGQMVTVPTTSSTAGVLDLRSCTFGGAYDVATNPTGTGAPSGVPVGLVGCYVTLICNVTVYIVFGPTLASVTGSNAPAITAVGSVNSSGIYTPATAVCYLLPQTTPVRFLTQVGVDNFLAWWGTDTGLLRIYQSSSNNIEG